MTALQSLIDETERWWLYHLQCRNHIEAAACAIRLRALRDAMEAVNG